MLLLRNIVVLDLKRSNFLYIKNIPDVKKLLNSKRCFSLLNTERLDRLKREIRYKPNDNFLILQFYKEANLHNPNEVIKHYENSSYIKNESITKEYIKALVYTNKLKYTNLNNIKYDSEPNFYRRSMEDGNNNINGINPEPSNIYETHNINIDPNYSNMSRSGHTNNYNDKKNGTHSEVFSLQIDPKIPLKVSLINANKKGLWGILKSTIGFLILVAAASVYLEGVSQNVQKGIGVSNKKVVPVENVKVTLADVKGCDEVKQELQEIIDYLKNSDKFTKIGAKLPKGILLSGEPGTGKTLIARAIAGEANVPFIQASGSEFEEMFVGVGARRIRELFQTAKKHAPCIVFIDEIDAVGSKRSNRDNSAVRMTLNQLLVELDGFEQNEGIVVICATNFPQSLDKALVRPGRLDKTIVVPLPDINGRYEILRMYSNKIILSRDVDLNVLARRTVGMTGADLKNILNIAAIKCSVEGKKSVDMNSIEQAFDRVVVGLQRKSPLSDEEKNITAYHEGGHTLVNFYTEGSDPVHKATIMPRGMSLGVTWKIPVTDKYSQKIKDIQSEIDVLMGGMVSEEIIFGKNNVTTGCSSDLQRATHIAQSLVMNYGVGINEENISMFLQDKKNISEDMKIKIDKSIQRILLDSYNRAKKVLNQHIDELHRVASALVEFETLTNDEIKLAMQGKNDQIRKNREIKQKEFNLKDSRIS
ncbi:ATP-dependent zinc metalloprotease FTSH, putative [Plasmodium berghei]|uniref:ATP-dependent zinc metalloprotease FTSH, putative n=2 Tax=Plasmodium berghei TaxID=5821 RepID=A0A509AQ11_PLABA|nr:ATP-dependent zinc metalloprotease FTSH, putative [Plasmodium berghei ANKA]CXI95343.1 ATP-dependent zinc metalloprotease FTSH, putative [Plasmodium berghei]SCL97132.1 ATP-dependent zinc metalloprotease FTSH, putative [Plasmodium berghei]SCM16558.1 ATP-dependent zinc metalloprotease FTSH, putative [Plasmodium berghei]SCM18355.1 ATP-dependent zinc metalloprotease FTSH, putative [Plasmodium berghei]SCN27785.1 ATP-dependent zinc metalloprotease FTSH, putative [Plasmodium berghei]|eukprot:XP_034423439.1 ATP-dependent zinc metalloprotease FTSH, putative [Plasmodium berghei ANKA]